MAPSTMDEDAGGAPAPDAAKAGRSLAERGARPFSVVGVGTSAGGLEASRKFFEALTGTGGMAYILVQHLDPSHDSMMVALLATHTALTVVEAAEGMRLERDHIYTIPPGAYLSVRAGVLHVSRPAVRHGARLPFDFLLHAMAADYGARAMAVILSGTGNDGTAGARAIRDADGLVIAQDPAEAAYGGMPQSAIGAGVVDLVLPAARMPPALRDFAEHIKNGNQAWPSGGADQLPVIVERLRASTPYNFSLYKPGTLRRRIARRMAMAGIERSDVARYAALLRESATEPDLLARDILINVTQFFRDPKAFELLEQTVLPALVRDHDADLPIRVWTAGCSTGEETYSIAMLLREQIAASRRPLKLQIIASDVDADALATAREGFYPDTIEADVSRERLARFFVKDDGGYRVLPDLRACVVFAVQDLLVDPPFSRLDLICCRNVLIYLKAEAQSRVFGLFHFGLRDGGMLLLGGAESIPAQDSRFELVSKHARLYRRIGRSRPDDVSLITRLDEVAVPFARAGAPAAASRSSLADLCQRMVIDRFAPAAVLINRNHECLYSLGPIDRFLRMVPGVPTHDLPAMARQETRIKLRAAIHQARLQGARVIQRGGGITHEGKAIRFHIDVQPLTHQGEELLLICFVEAPPAEAAPQPAAPQPGGAQAMTELESELDATREELRGAIRNLEISSEEQRAINEEALSVSEEYQSTNEELLTSKEELQSLNEELTALNGQLHETLERQRTTANDLKNVLYSTDVATIFLDEKLNIRFFTPAMNALFHIIATDIGRPLADLRALADDAMLFDDAREVLRSHAPRQRIVAVRDRTWYERRVLPYRTQDDSVEGVVITFADITERHNVASALETATRVAERATVAKSQFLAAASHDLRQPLQTLTLLQGLLARVVKGGRGQALTARFGEALGAMSAMLNTLLDTNHIEAGMVTPVPVPFRIGGLLTRLGEEFAYIAQSRGIALRVVASSLTVETDPRLLEQMLRNLLSNALKYTRRGKVLLGCRRRGDTLLVDVWDTGVGIARADLSSIFEEYHQLHVAGQERRGGLGLGLSIVRRLADLMGHRLDVQSRVGRGSVFSIAVPRGAPDAAVVTVSPPATPAPRATGVGRILVVDDDADIRDLLSLGLRLEGHVVELAADGATALDLIGRGAFHPDILLVDYNLPDGMSGLELLAALREALDTALPAIVLTGDVSTDALREIAGQDCIHLNKPVLFPELVRHLCALLPAAAAPQTAPATEAAGAVVHIIDDDQMLAGALREILEANGLAVRTYATGEAFVAAFRGDQEGCALVDAYLPGMSGFEVLRWIKSSGHALPAIMITGISDVAMAVDAMKAGALDFIEKPIAREEVLDCVEQALARSRDSHKSAAWRVQAARQLAALTPRQIEIMSLVLAGHPSKNIAADLRISQRTVENHRAAIMKKTGTRSLPSLVRLVLAANGAEG
jgi:two-component system CheB/CheR fusion protein